jgi:hypothetical protein
LVPVGLAGTSCLESKTWNSSDKNVLATYPQIADRQKNRNELLNQNQSRARRTRIVGFDFKITPIVNWFWFLVWQPFLFVETVQSKVSKNKNKIKE